MKLQILRWLFIKLNYFFLVFSVDAYNCWMGSPDKLAPRECPAGSDLCTTEQKDGAASYGCNKTDDLLPRFDAAGATAPDLSSGWACLTVADVEYCACNTDSCLPRILN